MQIFGALKSWCSMGVEVSQPTPPSTPISSVALFVDTAVKPILENVVQKNIPRSIFGRIQTFASVVSSHTSQALVKVGSRVVDVAVELLAVDDDWSNTLAAHRLHDRQELQRESCSQEEIAGFFALSDSLWEQFGKGLFTHLADPKQRYMAQIAELSFKRGLANLGLGAARQFPKEPLVIGVFALVLKKLSGKKDLQKILQLGWEKKCRGERDPEYEKFFQEAFVTLIKLVFPNGVADLSLGQGSVMSTLHSGLSTLHSLVPDSLFQAAIGKFNLAHHFQSIYEMWASFIAPQGKFPDRSGPIPQAADALLVPLLDLGLSPTGPLKDLSLQEMFSDHLKNVKASAFLEESVKRVGKKQKSVLTGLLRPQIAQLMQVVISRAASGMIYSSELNIDAESQVGWIDQSLRRVYSLLLRHMPKKRDLEKIRLLQQGCTKTQKQIHTHIRKRPQFSVPEQVLQSRLKGKDFSQLKQECAQILRLEPECLTPSLIWNILNGIKQGTGVDGRFAGLSSLEGADSYGDCLKRGVTLQQMQTNQTDLELLQQLLDIDESARQGFFLRCRQDEEVSSIINSFQEDARDLQQQLTQLVSKMYEPVCKELQGLLKLDAGSLVGIAGPWQKVLDHVFQTVLPVQFLRLIDEGFFPDRFAKKPTDLIEKLDTLSGSQTLSEGTLYAISTALKSASHLFTTSSWMAEQLLDQLNPEWSVAQVEEALKHVTLTEQEATDVPGTSRALIAALASVPLKEKEDVLKGMLTQEKGPVVWSALKMSLVNVLQEASLSMEEYLRQKKVQEPERSAQILRMSLIGKNTDDGVRFIQIYTGMEKADAERFWQLYSFPHAENMKERCIRAYCLVFPRSSKAEVERVVKGWHLSDLCLDTRVRSIAAASPIQGVTAMVEALLPSVEAFLAPLHPLSTKSFKGTFFEDVQRVLQTIILRFFFKIAKKYPGNQNETTLNLVVQQVVDIVQTIYQKRGAGYPEEEIVADAVQKLLMDVLQIRTAMDVKRLGIPTSFSQQAYDALHKIFQKQLHTMLSKALAIRPITVQEREELGQGDSPWVESADQLATGLLNILPRILGDFLQHDQWKEFVLQAPKELQPVIHKLLGETVPHLLPTMAPLLEMVVKNTCYKTVLFFKQQYPGSDARAILQSVLNSVCQIFQNIYRKRGAGIAEETIISEAVKEFLTETLRIRKANDLERVGIPALFSQQAYEALQRLLETQLHTLLSKCLEIRSMTAEETRQLILLKDLADPLAVGLQSVVQQPLSEFLRPETLQKLVPVDLPLPEKLQELLRKLIQESAPHLLPAVTPLLRDVLQNTSRRAMLFLQQQYPFSAENGETIPQILEQAKVLLIGLYKDCQEGIDPKQAVQTVAGKVVTELFRLRSAEDLQTIGVPQFFASKVHHVHDLIQQQIAEFLDKFIVPSLKKLQELSKEGTAPSEKTEWILKKFGRSVGGEFVVKTIAQKVSQEFLVHLFRDMVCGTDPHTSQVHGVKLIQHDLVMDNMKFFLGEGGGGHPWAGLLTVLSGYPLEQTGHWLAKQLTQMSPEARAFDAEAGKISAFVGDILLKRIVLSLDKLLDFGRRELPQEKELLLMTHLFTSIAHHFQVLSGVSEQEGGETHQSLVDAAHSSIHKNSEYPVIREIAQWIPGAGHIVIAAALDRLLKQDQDRGGGWSNDKFVKEFSKIFGLTVENQEKLRQFQQRGRNLVELVREQAFTSLKPINKSLYEPMSSLVIELVFPDGIEEGLAFLPQELRQWVGEKLENQLIPLALQAAVSALLKPENIKTMVLNGIAEANATLTAEFPLAPAAQRPTNQRAYLESNILPPFYEAAGALVQQLLKRTDLPPMLKERLQGPQMRLFLGKSMWSSLQGQLNGAFLENSLEKALKSAAQEGIIQYSFEGPLEDVDQAILKELQQLPENALGYWLRSTWQEAQQAFDRLMATTFGPIGSQVKEAFDAVFRLVFFTILGRVFLFLLYPAKKIIEKTLGSYIHKRIVKPLLDDLTRMPKDQPATFRNYRAFAENLIEEMYGALRETFVQYAPPLEPVQENQPE